MRKLSFWASLTMLSLGLGGCQVLSSLPFLGGGSQDAGDVGTAPVPAAPNTVPVNPPAEGAPEGQDPNAADPENPEFEDPVVEGADAELPAPDGLIPITGRDTAIKILAQNQGRQNPFATLPVRLPTAALTTAATEAVASEGGGGETRLTPTLPVFPIPPIPPQAQQRPEPFVPQEIPEEEIPPEEVTPFEWTGEPEVEEEPVQEFNPEALPPLPEPTIANGLTVTGVVNLGGSTKAIVQDEEGQSRYVSPGEYLGSGQVLVKRIEMNRGPQPVVVFEELGMEVMRAVGEPPAGGDNTSA
ncbi:MAG: hypothetical protein AAGA60_09990 [Cyanobacteria bacterium P01_E01_bin.42]